MPKSWANVFEIMNKRLQHKAILCGGALRAKFMQRLHGEALAEEGILKIDIKDLDIQGPHADMVADEQADTLAQALLAATPPVEVESFEIGTEFEPVDRAMSPSVKLSKAMNYKIQRGSKKEESRRLDVYVNQDDYNGVGTVQVSTRDFFENEDDPVEAFFESASFDIFQIAWRNGDWYMSDEFVQAMNNRVIRANPDAGWDNLLDVERNLKKIVEMIDRPEFKELGFELDMSHLPEETLAIFESRLKLAEGFLTKGKSCEQEIMPD